jgi:hypothetical protein
MVIIMRIIIAGSRYFDDYVFLEEQVNDILITEFILPTEFISGGAPGVDTLGEQYAKKHGWSVKRFPADWNKYGRAAGPIRNRQMAEYGDILIAFDAGGNGTKSMIQEMRKVRKKVFVVKI